MAMKTRRSIPLSWTDVVSSTGEILGSYAIDGRIIIVRSAKGWEKRAMASQSGSNAGLARPILSEPPPP
jgi:hypothetical protein